MGVEWAVTVLLAASLTLATSGEFSDSSTPARDARRLQAAGGVYLCLDTQFVSCGRFRCVDSSA